MRLTYSDARRGAKQADLCDDCSSKMPGRAAARRGRRPKSARRRRSVLERAGRPALRLIHRPEGAVLGQVYDRSMGLTLLAGPANAGKVELLLDRYLAALD